MYRIHPIFFIVLVVGCSSLRTYKLLDEGFIEEEFMYDSIKFTYKVGLMVIKARISGETVSLLIDTGAPNVISSSLVESLNLISINSEEVSDIHGSIERLQIVRLDTVTVGNTNFLNTIATVADFDETPFSCLGIDGLLGSNLMRYAIWDFNFQRQTIAFSSYPPKVDSNENVYTSKIFVGAAGVPAITLKLNGTKILNNTIDLGSNGWS